MSADGQSIKELHRGIIEGKTQEELDALLWDAVLTYQDQTLRYVIRSGIFLHSKT